MKEKKRLPDLISKHLLKGEKLSLYILWLNGVKNMENKMMKMFKYAEETPDISQSLGYKYT